MSDRKAGDEARTIGRTSTRREFPPFLQDMLSRPPAAGSGVHDWLFDVARNLHAHMPAGQIVRLLEERTRTCGRTVPKREIVEAVRDSLSCAWEPTGQAGAVQAAPKPPTINLAQRNAIIANGGGMADLWEASPHRFEDTEQHTEWLIDRLFPGNPFLCCGWASDNFDTRTREEWRGELGGAALIVPSPSTARRGLTKDNKLSAHALSITAPRRFLVVEFDQGTTDEHAALLMHLAGYAPLVLAVHSGGKSLHGWFWAGEPSLKNLLQGTNDPRKNISQGSDSVSQKIGSQKGSQKVEHLNDSPAVHSFFRYAVSLGADPKLWTRSQFCRMPDGTRENGKRQTVYFFNGEVIR